MTSPAALNGKGFFGEHILVLHEADVLILHLGRKILQFCLLTAALNKGDAIDLPVLDKRVAFEVSDCLWNQEEKLLQPLTAHDLNSTEQVVQVLAMVKGTHLLVEMVIDLRLFCMPFLRCEEGWIRRLPLERLRKEFCESELRSVLDAFEESPAEEADFKAMVLLFLQIVVRCFDFALWSYDLVGGVIFDDFVIVLLRLDQILILVPNLEGKIPVSDHLVSDDLWIQFLHHASDGDLLVLYYLFRQLSEVLVICI